MGKVVKHNGMDIEITKKDLKRDSDWFIDAAKQIIKIAEELQKGIEFDKQYALGKIFNAASLASKKKDSNVKVKEVYLGLGYPERTFFSYIDYYLTHTGFKEILSLGTADVCSKLPNYSITAELIGNDSQEKLEFYQDVIEWKGSNDVKVKDIRFYKKELKAKDEPEEPKRIVFESKSIEEEEEDNGVAWEEAVEIYKKKTGIDIDELEDEVEELRKKINSDVDLSVDVKQYLLVMGHKKWKKMYRIVAKALHPDLGGDENMMGLWKALSSDIEDAFTLMKFANKQDEFENLSSTSLQKKQHV